MVSIFLILCLVKSTDPVSTWLHLSHRVAMDRRQNACRIALHESIFDMKTWFLDLQQAKGCKQDKSLQKSLEPSCARWARTHQSLNFKTWSTKLTPTTMAPLISQVYHRVHSFDYGQYWPATRIPDHDGAEDEGYRLRGGNSWSFQGWTPHGL